MSIPWDCHMVLDASIGFLCAFASLVIPPDIDWEDPSSADAIHIWVIWVFSSSLSIYTTNSSLQHFRDDNAGLSLDIEQPIFFTPHAWLRSMSLARGLACWEKLCAAGLWQDLTSSVLSVYTVCHVV